MNNQPCQQTNSNSNPNGPIESGHQRSRSEQTLGSSPDNLAIEGESVQPHSQFLLVDDNSINLKASPHFAFMASPKYLPSSDSLRLHEEIAQKLLHGCEWLRGSEDFPTEPGEILLCPNG